MSSYVPPDNPYAQNWMRKQSAGKKYTKKPYDPYAYNRDLAEQRERARQAWADSVNTSSSYYEATDKRSSKKSWMRKKETPRADYEFDPYHYAPNVPNPQAQEWLRQNYPDAQGQPQTLKSARKPTLKVMPKPVHYNEYLYPFWENARVGPNGPQWPQWVAEANAQQGGARGQLRMKSFYPRRGGGGGYEQKKYARVTPMEGQQGFYNDRRGMPQYEQGRYAGRPVNNSRGWLQQLTRFRIGS